MLDSPWGFLRYLFFFQFLQDKAILAWYPGVLLIFLPKILRKIGTICIFDSKVDFRLRNWGRLLLYFLHSKLQLQNMVYFISSDRLSSVRLGQWVHYRQAGWRPWTVQQISELILIAHVMVGWWFFYEAIGGYVHLWVNEHLVSFIIVRSVRCAAEQLRDWLILTYSIFRNAKHLYLSLLFATTSRKGLGFLQRLEVYVGAYWKIRVIL